MRKSCSRMSSAMRSSKWQMSSEYERLVPVCYEADSGTSTRAGAANRHSARRACQHTVCPKASRAGAGVAHQRCSRPCASVERATGTFQVVQHQAMDANVARAARIGIQLPPDPAMAVHPAGHIPARPVPHVQRSLPLAGLLLLSAESAHPPQLSRSCDQPDTGRRRQQHGQRVHLTQSVP